MLLSSFPSASFGAHRDSAGRHKCTPAPSQLVARRLRKTGVVCLASDETSASKPNEAELSRLAEKNEEQLDKLIMELAALRQRQRETGEGDEDEMEDEFAEDGDDWVWWRADDKEVAETGETSTFARQATTESSLPSTSTANMQSEKSAVESATAIPAAQASKRSSGRPRASMPSDAASSMGTSTATEDPAASAAPRRRSSSRSPDPSTVQMPNDGAILLLKTPRTRRTLMQPDSIGEGPVEAAAGAKSSKTRSVRTESTSAAPAVPAKRRGRPPKQRTDEAAP